MKYQLLALSSSGERFYHVVVTIDEDYITAKCDCPAGAFNGGVCKHIAALITGRPNGIYYAKDNERIVLSEVINIMEASGLRKKYDALNERLNVLEKKFKAKKAAIKKEIAELV